MSLSGRVTGTTGKRAPLLELEGDRPSPSPSSPLLWTAHTLTTPRACLLPPLKSIHFRILYILKKNQSSRSFAFSAAFKSPTMIAPPSPLIHYTAPPFRPNRQSRCQTRSIPTVTTPSRPASHRSDLDTHTQPRSTADHPCTTINDPLSAHIRRQWRSVNDATNPCCSRWLLLRSQPCDRGHDEEEKNNNQ